MNKGATSSSITLSITGIGFINLTKSFGISFALSLSNNVLQKTTVKNYNRYKKQYQKIKRTIKSFKKQNRKNLQGILMDENEYKSLCKIFTKYLNETEIESFYK